MAVSGKPCASRDLNRRLLILLLSLATVSFGIAIDARNPGRLLNVR